MFVHYLCTLLFCISHFLQIKQCDRCQINAAETGVPDIRHPVKVVDKVWYLVDAHKWPLWETDTSWHKQIISTSMLKLCRFILRVLKL